MVKLVYIMEIKPISNAREFTAFPELQKLTDEELQEKYLRGTNIHIDTSDTAAAKRLLDIRTQQKQLRGIQNVETVTQQLQKSHEEILKIVNKTNEITNILAFIKSHYLPNKPLWIKIPIFILGTIILSIFLNIAASYIATFWLHWR